MAVACASEDDPILIEAPLLARIKHLLLLFKEDGVKGTEKWGEQESSLWPQNIHFDKNSLKTYFMQANAR